jgi:predicted SnoaL-like aldol condensation-catalyzing enzyme
LGDGLAALEARLKSRSKGSVKANTVRAFEDGELVFTHTEFNFSGNSRIAFDIFRFEDGQIAEHWDTLETIPPRADWKNPNGKF